MIKNIKKLYKNNKKIAWVFISIFLIKLLIAGLFSSDYQNQMFIPFVKNFINGIKNGIYNPYQSWYILKNGLNFPYQFVMLLIESCGSLLIDLFNIKSIFFVNLLFKLPIILFDLIGLIFLFKIFPRRKKEIGILYYTSPIILYSSYIYSQLDIIPISILIISLYFLIKGNSKNNLLFALFLGLSIMTKHSIMIVAPILYIYLYKKDGILQTIKCALVTTLVIMLFLVPFISDGYINNVIFNTDQSIILNLFINYNHMKVYLPVLILLIIYLNAFTVSSINKDLLFGYCAVAFSVFLALIPAMPAWFVWIIPFTIAILASDNVQNKEKVMQVYYIFNSLYIAFMVFGHKNKYTDIIFWNYKMNFLKLNNQVIVNIIFTCFISSLIYLIYILYKNGLYSNKLYKRRNTPFIIGIAGDSGSGKSTLVNIIKKMFKSEKILLIEGDGDHKWERNEKMWEQFTHLNPKANYLYRQARNIEQLRNGQKINRVDYNHETGKFSKQYQIRQKKYIIINGLHTLYLPQLRKNLDIKIYMDTDETLKKFWKIQRDSKSRGYSVKQILNSIKKRTEDYQKYIYPQKKYADLIITYFDKNLTSKQFNTDYKEKISIKFTFDSSIDLEPIVNALKSYGINSRYDFIDDLEKQTIIFDYDDYINTDADFDEILNNILFNPDELSISINKLKNNQERLIKLIMIGIINQKLMERE